MSQFVSLTVLASFGSFGATPPVPVRDSVPDDGRLVPHVAPHVTSNGDESDDDDRIASGAPTLPATPAARRVARSD